MERICQKVRCTLLREMRRMKKICAGSIHIWSDCLRMADMSSLDKDKKSEKVLSCQKTCDKIERNGQKKETSCATAAETGGSMEVLYRSTRGNEESVSASKAILEGLASDGGLFVPQALPSFDKTLDEFAQMDYRQTAYEVMKLLLTDFTEEELRYCIDKAYDGKFDTEAIAPLAEVKNAWYLELFHGPTIAFKDMALSILPYLMTTAAKKNQIKNEIVILTATSGDTGKAALAGFADVPGTRIMVFYPRTVSVRSRKSRWFTQTGANTCVIGTTEISTTPSPASRSCLQIKSLQHGWKKEAISSLLQTPLISDVWFPRSFIMFMHMHSL